MGVTEMSMYNAEVIIAEPLAKPEAVGIVTD
jgi:hypothetical protein